MNKEFTTIDGRPIGWKSPNEVVHLCALNQPCHADVLLEIANRPLTCEAA